MEDLGKEVREHCDRPGTSVQSNLRRHDEWAKIDFTRDLRHTLPGVVSSMHIQQRFRCI